jgi:hypothetical protein
MAFRLLIFTLVSMISQAAFSQKGETAVPNGKKGASASVTKQAYQPYNPENLIKCAKNMASPIPKTVSEIKFPADVTEADVKAFSSDEKEPKEYLALPVLTEGRLDSPLVANQLIVIKVGAPLRENIRIEHFNTGPGSSRGPTLTFAGGANWTRDIRLPGGEHQFKFKREDTLGTGKLSSSIKGLMEPLTSSITYGPLEKVPANADGVLPEIFYEQTDSSWEIAEEATMDSLSRKMYKLVSSKEFSEIDDLNTKSKILKDRLCSCQIFNKRKFIAGTNEKMRALLLEIDDKTNYDRKTFSIDKDGIMNCKL